MDTFVAPTMRSQSFSSISWQEESVDKSLLRPKQVDLSKQAPGPAARSHLPGVCLFYNLVFMLVGFACLAVSIAVVKADLRIFFGATLGCSFLFTLAQAYQVHIAFKKTLASLVAPPKAGPLTPSWMDFATRGFTPKEDTLEFWETLKAGWYSWWGYQNRVHADDLSPLEPGTFQLGDDFSPELLEVSAHDRMKAYYTQFTGPSDVKPWWDQSDQSHTLLHLGIKWVKQIWEELAMTLSKERIYNLDCAFWLAAFEDALSWLAWAAYNLILGMLLRACYEGGDLAAYQGALGAIFVLAGLILLGKNYSQTRRSSAQVALQEKIWLSWDFVPKTKDKFQEEDMNALGSMVVNDKLVGSSSWAEEDDVKGNLPQAWMMLASTLTHIGACYMACLCHNNAMLSKEMIHNAIGRKFNYPGLATLYLQAKRCIIACWMALIAPCMLLIPESMLTSTEVKSIWLCSFFYMIKNLLMLVQRADHGDDLSEFKKLHKYVPWYTVRYYVLIAVPIGISVALFVKFHVMTPS